MVTIKSQVELLNLIRALLRDIQMSHSEVFSQRAMRLTVQKIVSRTEREGVSFLTKALPRLGKAFDRALSGEAVLDSAELAFKSLPGSKLPMFMGELFQRCFSHDGRVLTLPCVRSVRDIRQVLFMYYKLDTGYTPKQEDKVVAQFIETENDIAPYDTALNRIADTIDAQCDYVAGTSLCVVPLVGEGNEGRNRDLSSVYHGLNSETIRVIRNARSLLNKLFLAFDPTDIHPTHGPGAVSTRERLWAKYVWTNIPTRLSNLYPLDAYFYASLGHICDCVDELQSVGDKENSARVILVPKDSRGPRLISCEPLEFQWIQQGLGRAIVSCVERHRLTAFNVHFTDQRPNQLGALLGSANGEYATLDLKEASDRVSVGLVRVLFPSRVLPYLLAARSLSTRLPDGRELTLRKFAPMGSALCFPILALTIWAILTAGAPDADTRESVLVYGDDVIVPTAYAANAIELLEAFGLLCNRAKSCITGSFRESCGVDAFKGENVTPLRLRRAWSSKPNPDDYPSRIAFANALWDRQYYRAYWECYDALIEVYKQVPSDDMLLSVSSLRHVLEEHKPTRSRTNVYLQKRQWHVWDVTAVPIRKEMDGWRMLLRYFAEATHDCPVDSIGDGPGERIERCANRVQERNSPIEASTPFSVRVYTKRNAMKIARRWR